MKTAAVFVEDLYQEMEVWVPAYRLREAGLKVVFVGTGKPEYKSKLGYPVKADVDVKDVKAGEVDVLVVPGGFAPDYLRRHEAVSRLVRDIDKAGRPIGAICHALWVLCSAGILKGRRVTSFFAIKDDVVNAGADWVDAEVVVDRNLVTSRKPDDLPAFCRELVTLAHP